MGVLQMKICGYLLTPQEVHKMDRTLNLMIKQDEKNEKNEIKAELKISNEKQEYFSIKSQNNISILA